MIGLQRGSRWSVLGVKPPYLNGPHFSLMLKKGVLTGAIDAPTAPGGSVRIQITPDGASGYGPLGQVSIDFTEQEGLTEVEGLWNGGRVHFTFASDAIRGSVMNNSFFYGRENPSEKFGQPAFHNVLPTSRITEQLNANTVDPLPEDITCDYFLTERRPDGSLAGGSICAGMPQQTRLEIPQEAQQWLTKPELLTLLVVVLSAPPQVASEETGPRWLPPRTMEPMRRLPR